MKNKLMNTTYTNLPLQTNGSNNDTPLDLSHSLDMNTALLDAY